MEYTVYIHTAPNNKRYVGITKKLPEKRWNGGRGYISQQLFYRAIEKYGWENIEHKIISTNLTEDEAKQLEIELIAKYNSTNPQFGYNVSPGGDLGNGLVGESHPLYGKKPSAETRMKISRATAGRKPWNLGIKGVESSFKGKRHTEHAKRLLSESASRRTGARNPKAKSVICITTGEVFETATSAAKHYGCNQSNITYCLLGRQHYACRLEDGTKLRWAYYD